MKPTSRKPHYLVSFGVIALGTFAYMLLQSMVLPALPVIEKSLHTTETGVAWVLTAYLLSASVATPILGRLGDLYGKRKMLVLVFGALSAGSVLAGLSNSIGLLITARVIQGLAGAVFPLGFAVIRDEFPVTRVAFGIGLISTLLGFGSGVGLIVGGPVVEHLSFHFLFWIPLAMSVPALLLSLRFIPESPARRGATVSIRAALCLSGWLVALLVGVTEGPTWGWASPSVLGLFAASAILFFAWVRIERHLKAPLVDMKMMRIPIVWWTNISALLFGVGMYSVIIVLPPFLETPRSAGYGFSASATGAGLYLAPMAGAMLVVGLVMGRVTARFGSKAPLVLGGALASAPFVWLSFEHTLAWGFYLASGLMGLGVGLAFAAMSNLVVEAVPRDQTGVASGMNANIRTIGGAIGSVVVASVITSGTTANGLPKLGGYVTSFAILAAAFACATVAALIVPGRALQEVKVVQALEALEPTA